MILFSQQYIKAFGSYTNPSKYYKKGLSDIKKVLGEPIGIFTDTTFKVAVTDFYLWKIKRNKGYFLVYYILNALGLSFNLNKMFGEQTINEHIRNDIYAEQRYRGRSYYINTKELNMPDWY